MSHNKVTSLQTVVHGATTEVLQVCWNQQGLNKVLQGPSGSLCFLRPSFCSASFLQMWMNACSRESVSTAGVSIWTAPTSAPVTMVTKPPQTAKPVKVCEGLSKPVGCNSSPHASQLVELFRQQHNVFSANYFFLLDVNECAAGNMCPAGICINTEGSYTCQNCRPGFGPSADGLRCDGITCSLMI